jgi:hypothetical protein
MSSDQETNAKTAAEAPATERPRRHPFEKSVGLLERVNVGRPAPRVRAKKPDAVQQPAEPQAPSHPTLAERIRDEGVAETFEALGFVSKTPVRRATPRPDPEEERPPRLPTIAERRAAEEIKPEGEAS